MNYGKKHASEKQKEITSESTMKKKRFISRLFKSIVICILIIGITAVIGVGIFVKKTIDDAPEITPEKVQPDGYTTFVLDQNGTKIDKFISSGSNRVHKNFDEIPEYLRNAFIAIEDERYEQHHGIDMKGIIRSGLVGLVSGNFSQGASTITQQLIKNTMFPDFMNETTLEKVKRKIQEQYLAIQIEKQMDKNLILENYMNTINLGQNTLGVQAASTRYFNKDVSELTLSECAVIAGITQSPSRLNPVTNPEANSKRRKKVLDNMLSQKRITQAEYDEALKDDVYARIQNVNTQLADTSSVNSYFIDALADQVIDDLQEKLGYSESQALNALYSGGLTIHATQDRGIQEICDEVMNNDSNYPAKISVGVEYALTVTRADGTQENYDSVHLKRFGKSAYNDAQGLLFSNEEAAKERIDAFKASIAQEGDTYDEKILYSPQPQASAVVIDQRTGQVKALVGGRGAKTSNRSLNRATSSKRQPGSAFKIIAVYAPALDSAGQTLGTVNVDEAFSANGKEYKNAYDGFRGPMTMRSAIEISCNIVALKTFQEITPQLGIDYAEKLGISTMVKSEEINGKVYTDYALPTALGGVTHGVYNLEMAGAYATIANGGVYNKPTFYTKIEDHDGKTLLNNNEKGSSVLRESTAFLLTNAMEGVVKNGTGRQASLGGMPVAGKTGTTTSRKDSWFCGYTPYYTCSVWVGYDDNAELPDGNFNLMLWRGIMSRIHRNLPEKQFDMPDSVAYKKICSITGKIANDTCPYHMEYVALDGGSNQTCTGHSGYKGSLSGHSSNKHSDKKKETEEKTENTEIEEQPSEETDSPSEPPSTETETENTDDTEQEQE